MIGDAGDWAALTGEKVRLRTHQFWEACVIGGAGGGAGFAYLKHVSTPVFTDVNTLRKISGRPVLGAISMSWLEEHRYRQYLNLASFSAAGGLLMLTFICSVVFQDAGVSALQLLKLAEG